MAVELGGGRNLLLLISYANKRDGAPFPPRQASPLMAGLAIAGAAFVAKQAVQTYVKLSAAGSIFSTSKAFYKVGCRGRACAWAPWPAHARGRGFGGDGMGSMDTKAGAWGRCGRAHVRPRPPNLPLTPRGVP